MKSANEDRAIKTEVGTTTGVTKGLRHGFVCCVKSAAVENDLRHHGFVMGSPCYS